MKKKLKLAFIIGSDLFSFSDSFLDGFCLPGKFFYLERIMNYKNNKFLRRNKPKILHKNEIWMTIDPSPSLTQNCWGPPPWFVRWSARCHRTCALPCDGRAAIGGNGGTVHVVPHLRLAFSAKKKWLKIWKILKKVPDLPRRLRPLQQLPLLALQLPLNKNIWITG